MSAPAALAMAKLFYPETEKVTKKDVVSEMADRYNTFQELCIWFVLYCIFTTTLSCEYVFRVTGLL